MKTTTVHKNHKIMFQKQSETPTSPVYVGFISETRTFRGKLLATLHVASSKTRLTFKQLAVIGFIVLFCSAGAATKYTYAVLSKDSSKANAGLSTAPASNGSSVVATTKTGGSTTPTQASKPSSVSVGKASTSTATSKSAATSTSGSSGAKGSAPLPVVPSTPQPDGITGQWSLAFDDEFNGTSLDLNNWIPNVGGSSDTQLTPSANSPTTYDPSQATVSNGDLSLAAISKTEDNEPYTSGGVWTGNGKFSIAPTANTPVVMEARIDLPAASIGVIANWPAFWAAGTNWPNDGEIDTMEGLGGSAAYHFHYGTSSDEQSEGASVAGDYTGWHTYSVIWTTSSVTFFYDGLQVGQLTSGITDQPMPIILNYAVGGYGGPIVTPATMLVDYVRVWN
jgi:hypothetical protein